MQVELEPIPARVNEVCAFHGGKFFEAIGEDFQALERAGGVISADVLDAWFDPSPRVLRKLERFLPFLLRTSPPVHAGGLVAAIARARCLPEDSILTGGGSSDLIFTCLPRLSRRLRTAMILDPMYGEYRHVLEAVMGVDLIRFALHKEENFAIDTDRLIAAVQFNRPDLVALVNPNSPTGQHWPRAEAVRFLDSVPSATTVVIDETYIEYAGSDESIESEATARENVIVLKSMSKVYALSGLRAGYLVAAPSTIHRLGPWMPPWAVSLPAQVAAVEALADNAYYEQRYQETHSLREALAYGLQRDWRVVVYPSIANFLLVEVPTSAQRIIEHMRESNVFIRNCDSMGERFADRFVRIAVKRAPENRRIAAALAESLGL
jgi:histidinol-phosphate/aromatic aminotransferase/cobyric acid decarboxylase-like protein